jgi:hypothetical protein
MRRIFSTSLVPFVLATLLPSLSTPAVSQASVQRQNSQPTSTPAAAHANKRSNNRGREVAKGRQESVMTNEDVLRFIDLGVPITVIIDRIRANQTDFDDLDELLAEIRSRDTSRKDPWFFQLVTEISVAKYRDGASCIAESAACPKISSGLVTGASASSALDRSDPDPPMATQSSSVPAPTVADQAPSPSAQDSKRAPAPAGANTAGSSQNPVPVPTAGSTVAETNPASAPTRTTTTNSPSTISQIPSPSKAAKEFADKQGQLAADEYEKNKYRNQYLLINPIRMVFDPTEVGEKVEKDIAISVRDNFDEQNSDLKVLSIRLSTQEDLEVPSKAFSLVQPDLQCPEILSSSEECHLKLQFHPARDGFNSAYINIVTEIIPKPPAQGDEQARKTGTNEAAEERDRGRQLYFDRAYIHGTGYVSDVARLNGTGPLSNFPALRSVMGFDISGASNAATQQKFFLEFNLNAPIGFARWGAKVVPCTKEYSELAECKGKGPETEVQLDRRDPLSRPFWAFVNPRITSVPQSPTSLGSLNIQSISNSITGNNNTTNLVQGLELQGGVEFYLIRPRSGLPVWSVVKNAHARTGLALVGGLGFTTPFSPPDKTTQEFTINPTILAQFPDAGIPQLDASGNPVTPNIIAFVNKDRTRFFRRFYTGIRFKTYFLSDRVRGECDDPSTGDRCEGLINQFPGVIDVTAAKDEAVTAGHLSKWILRLDAVYPLPFIPAFHIFGGANIAFGKNMTTAPLILEPPSTFLNFSDPHVFVQSLDPPNRDTYRLGLGIDLLQVIKGKVAKPAAAPQSGSDERRKDKGETSPSDSGSSKGSDES